MILAGFFEDPEERQAAGAPPAESTLAHRDVATGEWTIHGIFPAMFITMAAEDKAVWLVPFGPDGEADDLGEGVLRFDGDTWTRHDVGTPVADMAVAADGTIWVATPNGELRQLSRSSAG